MAPMKAPRCIVVGAGMIGATVALRLAQRGAAVTLLDGRGPGMGTSGTTFAWVNASSKEPHAYFALNAAGVAAHARLAAEFMDAPWLVPTGNLEWETSASGQEQLAARASRLSEWGYALRHLTRREVERLEPDLLVEPEVDDVAFYPDECFVFPHLYLACVLRAARERGAVLRMDEEVAEITMQGSRASEVVLRSGAQLRADAIVCCSGRWTPELLRPLGVAVPLVSPDVPGSPAVGLLVRTPPVLADVRRVVHPPGLALRPDGGGRLLLHGDAFDAEVAVDMPVPLVAAAAARLVEAVRPYVRHMEHTPVASAAVGIRPLPVDGVSVAGWVPTVEGLYVIVTHSGVTLAPILAELAAREIHGATEPLLAPFRPQRFTTLRATAAHQLAPWAEAAPDAPYPMTVDELHALSDDGWAYELVNGVLVRMPLSSGGASSVGMRLAIRLGAYVEENGLGIVTGEQGGYRLDPAHPRDTEVAPDVAFVRADRAPSPDSPVFYGQAWELAPDLAVEVAAENQYAPGMAAKAQFYLRCGTRLVWVIWPRYKRVDVWRAGDDTPTALSGEDALDGDDVVPGFTYPIARLFP